MQEVSKKGFQFNYPWPCLLSESYLLLSYSLGSPYLFGLQPLCCPWNWIPDIEVESENNVQMNWKFYIQQYLLLSQKIK